MNAEEYKMLSIKEFDGAAKKFDDDDPSVYNLCRQDYPEILEELEKESFTDVLDAGCGTGAVIALLGVKYPKKHFTGLDLSTKMIEVAKKKKIANATFVNGDCENLPFQAKSFDAITCSMSFHHYPNPELFFKSCVRVLRPGGRLILRDMTVPAPLLWFVNCIEIPIINHLLHKGDVRTYGEKDIIRLCKESGMEFVSFERRKGMRLHAICRKPVSL